MQVCVSSLCCKYGEFLRPIGQLQSTATACRTYCTATVQQRTTDLVEQLGGLLAGHGACEVQRSDRPCGMLFRAGLVRLLPLAADAVCHEIALQHPAAA